jgi:hypothetical protein
MPYCPHCSNEIDHLNYESNYSEYGDEYGRCNCDGSDWESEERNSNDGENSDTRYMCPECEHEVDPDEITDVREEDNDDDIVSELEQDYDPSDEECTDGGHQIVRPSTNNIIIKPEKTLAKSVECPECHQINFRDLNEACICSNCNYEIE